jgi:surface antigen
MTARTLVAFLTLSLLPVAAPADPTSWSPASGWRGNGEPAYLGYNDREWDNDYGVVRGRCDTAALGVALDGRQRRAVAVMVGPSIIAGMDERDRACVGQALELAGKKKTVIWKNDATGVSYRLTPTRNFRRDGVPCREFTTRVFVDGRVRAVYGAACRRGDGEWEFVG